MLLEVGRAHWQSMAKRASPFPVSAEGLPLQFIEVGRTPSHCGALATCVHVHAGRAAGQKQKGGTGDPVPQAAQPIPIQLTHNAFILFGAISATLFGENVSAWPPVARFLLKRAPFRGASVQLHS